MDKNPRRTLFDGWDLCELMPNTHRIRHRGKTIAWARRSGQYVMLRKRYNSIREVQCTDAELAALVLQKVANAQSNIDEKMDGSAGGN